MITKLATGRNYFVEDVGENLTSIDLNTGENRLSASVTTRNAGGVVDAASFSRGDSITIRLPVGEWQMQVSYDWETYITLGFESVTEARRVTYTELLNGSPGGKQYLRYERLVSVAEKIVVPVTPKRRRKRK